MTDKSQLISESYLAALKDLHKGPRGFGNSGRKHAAEVVAMASVLKINSILDYGAGGGTLKETLLSQGYSDGPLNIGRLIRDGMPISDVDLQPGTFVHLLPGDRIEILEDYNTPWVNDFREYDPAIEGIDALPLPAELLICTDTLEHVEPDRIDAVLTHIRSLTLIAAYLVISTQPAHKTLRDGRNAHLIVESPEWWWKKVESVGFRLISRFVRSNDEGVAEVKFWVR